MKKISKFMAAAAIAATLALTAVGPASAGIIGSDRRNSSTSLGSSFDADLYAVAYSFSPGMASFLVRTGLLR